MNDAGRSEHRAPADIAARRRAVEALDHHEFLDAGAGAGKTTVLVEHYLHALQQTPDLGPRQIIAVTFTNKAAAEMKERLRGECRRRESGPDARRWRDIARELETAPIDTIHGLCSRLLHENAVAAGVDPEFAVLEGADQTLLLEATVRRSLLDRLDRDEAGAATVVARLGLRVACGAIEHLVSNRARLAEALFPDGRPPTAEELLARWEGMAPQIQALLLGLLPASRAWRRAKAALEAHRANAEADVLEQLRIKRLRLIRQAEDAGLPATSRLDALRLLREGQVSVKRADQWPDEDAKETVAEALRSFSTRSGANYKAIEQVLGDEEDAPDTDCAYLTGALLAETAAALNAYDRAKRAMSALDFEDLQLRVRDLWRDAPHVLRQVQSRTRHVLVDEFQDTDELQKGILWALSGGGARLFVVGDAKQSIYRFRNADVTVFNRTRAEMERMEGGGLDRLEVNFRSTPALTAFFNDLFSRAEVMGGARGREYEAFYEPLQSHRLDGETDAVEVVVVRRAEKQTEDEEDAAPETLADLREKEAAAIAARLRKLVEEGMTVGGEDGRPRPVRWGDCGVLFRATGDLPTYERALRNEGVPYYVVAGRGFYGRQEVRDVVHCLRAIENVHDETALVGALRSPLFALSDETLFWLSHLPGPWWERVQAAAEGLPPGPADNIPPEELDRVGFAARTLADLRARKNRMTLSRLVNEIIERTGLSATLVTRFGGDQMVSNLRKLSDIAGEVEQSGSFSLRGLIRRLQELVVREEREGQAPVAEERADVVKLMTIHAAKGLEWPVVVVPDLCRKSPGRSGNVITHPCWGVVARPQGEEHAQWPAIGIAVNALNDAEELAEERRLFYVACTRARDRLILTSAISGDAAPADTALEWLAEAFRLDPSQPGQAPLQGAGWRGAARVVSSDRVAEPPTRRTAAARPDLAGLAGRLARGEAPDGGPEAEALVRRAMLLEPRLSARRRFHVTELAAYLDCPRKYLLHNVQGAPEETPQPPDLERETGLSPIELGLLVHRMLRIIGTAGHERLEEAVQLSLGPQHAPGDETARRVRAMVAAYLDSDLYARLVRPARRLRTEMTVLFELPCADPQEDATEQEETALVEGKIDALVEADDGGLHVLDFKTGRRADGAAAEHEFQLGLYCAGVVAARGEQPASAAIVYVGPEAPEVVDIAVGQASPAAAREAACAIRGIRAGRFAAPCTERCARCGLRWTCGAQEGI